MRLLTTTALLLALGSATAATAGPAAIHAGLTSAGQTAIERVQYWAPATITAPVRITALARIITARPLLLRPGRGRRPRGLVGGAVAGAAGAVAGAAAPPAAVAAPAPGVAVAAAPGEPIIDEAYCRRRYRSYDCQRDLPRLGWRPPSLPIISSGSDDGQPLQKRALAVEYFAARLCKREPAGAIDLGKYLRLAGLRRPDHLECVADDFFRIDIAVERPGGDDFPAG